tara:strand:- start:128 stop:553 length:426 start_codon:yes stop_codon:yes gene_type:complete
MSSEEISDKTNEENDQGLSEVQKKEEALKIAEENLKIVTGRYNDYYERCKKPVDRDGVGRYLRNERAAWKEWSPNVHAGNIDDNQWVRLRDAWKSARKEYDTCALDGEIAYWQWAHRREFKKKIESEFNKANRRQNRKSIL